MAIDPQASRRLALPDLGRAAGAPVPTGLAPAGRPPGSLEAQRLSRGRGWYATFCALALILTVTVSYFTGLDAVGATSRFLWNATALITNGTIRAAGGLLLLLARGIGWRRLARLATTTMGVGLSYSGGIILSEPQLKRAKGWTGTLSALFIQTRNRWLGLHLACKIAIVAVLIASQIYLHFLLILFPIAFLVPVVRRIWVRAADIALGSWYWRAFGRTHRAAIARLRAMAGVREVVGAVRLARIRYLRAWRLWRYDPRYRRRASGKHIISLIEPVRLWWRGELDDYVGRPLLCGPLRRSQAGRARASSAAPAPTASGP
jgi:hypothetical protein